MTTPGRFLTFEGGEGSGKSTQLRLLAEAFARAGVPHLVTREPGGTTGAESIRRLLVEGDGDRWDPTTETILFMAARVDHVRKKIIPALRAGTHVLCDRFADSTLVYQGLGKGLGAPFIHMLHDFCLGNFAPDLTLVLDIPAEQGLARAAARHGTETRFEGLDISFHRAVRQGFLDIAAAEPNRCVVINATEPPETIHAAILHVIEQRWGVRL